VSGSADDKVRAYRNALAIARAGWVTVAELLRRHDPGGPLRESLKMIELIDGLDAAAVEAQLRGDADGGARG
jgi:hypothetical protein